MAVAPDERVAVDEHSKETRHVINRDVDGSTSNALAALLVSHGFKSLPLDSPLAATAGASIYLAAPRDSIPWAQLEDGGALTLVNKIRGHELLTRKSKLARLLRDHSAQPHPQTFVLVPEPLRAPKEGISAIQADKRRALAAEDEKERAALLEADAASPSCWIVKDAQGAKGDNIAICPSASDALLEAESGRHGTAVVVQRYLRSPLLLPGGRKFDVRLWVLFDADYRVFIHRQGVCRTSSCRYDPDALTDTLSHITNHCVQERGASFEKYEAGNELFFGDFDRVLRESAGISLSEHIWPQFRSIVKHVAEAAHDTLAPPSAQLSHEAGTKRGGVRGWQLFGFDFLIDAEQRVHLLEINGSPAIADALRACITADLARLLIARLAPQPSVAPASLELQPRAAEPTTADRGHTPSISALRADTLTSTAGQAPGEDAAATVAAGAFELVYTGPDDCRPV